MLLDEMKPLRSKCGASAGYTTKTLPPISLLGYLCRSTLLSSTPPPTSSTPCPSTSATSTKRTEIANVDLSYGLPVYRYREVHRNTYRIHHLHRLLEEWVIPIWRLNCTSYYQLEYKCIRYASYRPNRRSILEAWCVMPKSNLPYVFCSRAIWA